MRALSLLFVAALCQASSPTDPASVLVIVQDNTGPETGTGGVNAGQWVADHYMTARGIPAGNILHISTFVENGQGASCTPGQATCNLSHSSSTNISYANYLSLIEAPLVAKLNANSGALAASIRYIVPTYGVPISIVSRTSNGITVTSQSIDAQIACLNQSRMVFQCTNPYWSQDPLSTPVHIDQFTPGYYIVTRLDGPSAVISAGLVDKAMTAEAGLNKRAGVGYFDWQGLGNIGNQGQTANLTADYAMYRSSTLCTTAGLHCSLNNQQVVGHLINNAPNTLWAWGWYSSTAVNDVYSFVSGAVGAQLTSYTANFVRSQGTGSWVPFWLSKGITATWGVTGEPGSASRDNHTYGDTLLNHFWRGYTFGESYAMSNTYNGWMHIAIGDPLYQPKFTGPSHVGRGVTFKGTIK